MKYTLVILISKVSCLVPSSSSGIGFGEFSTETVEFTVNRKLVLFLVKLKL